MTKIRKRAAILVIAIVIGIGATACLPTTGPDPDNPYQNMLLNAMNADRAKAGLPRLTWSPKLSVLAMDWANQMARDNNLYHQNLSAVLGRGDYGEFWTLGENILVGPGNMPISQMESVWMNSAGHRANILSGNYNVVGLAFVNGPDGRLWVCVDFGGV